MRGSSKFPFIVKFNSGDHISSNCFTNSAKSDSHTCSNGHQRNPRTQAMAEYFCTVKQQTILRVKGGTDVIDGEISATGAESIPKPPFDKPPANRPKAANAKATPTEKSKPGTRVKTKPQGGDESSDRIDSRQSPAAPRQQATPPPDEPAPAPAPPPAAEAASPAASPPPPPAVAEAYGFYALLGVERDCAPAAIRAAYLRLALAAHPDRHPTDPSAKARFQALQWVYETLRDPDRRRLYDEGGGSAAMAGGDDGPLAGGGGLEALLAHLRGAFRRAGGPEGIARFEAEYRGSAMEAADVEEVRAGRATPGTWAESNWVTA